jgi:hypothetical protein
MKAAAVPLAVLCGLCGLIAGCGGGGGGGGVQITGRVVDRYTGQGVAGVVIELGTASATSGSDGRFILRGVPTGEQRFAIVPPSGYSAPAPMIVDVPPTADSLDDIGGGVFGSQIALLPDGGGSGGGPPPPPPI